MEKDKIGSIPRTVQQHEFQVDQDLNVVNKITLLGENTGEFLYNLKVEKTSSA